MLSKENANLIMHLSRNKESDFYVEPEQFEVVNVKGTKYGYKCRDGTLLMNTVQNLACVKNLELKNDDTFVIGFLKSGNYYK